MKKLLISFLALMGFVLPSLAQVSHDYNSNDREPSLSSVTLSKDQIPSAILTNFRVQFEKNDPLTWSKFPYTIKEYGFVYDIAAADVKLDRYLVTMKTDKGNDLWAVYNSDGELVESREIYKDVSVPPAIMDAFSKSQYKDWNIVGNKEIIKYYYDGNFHSVEQHFRITVEKDNVRRSISFNYQVSN